MYLIAIMKVRPIVYDKNNYKWIIDRKQLIAWVVDHVIKIMLTYNLLFLM